MPFIKRGPSAGLTRRLAWRLALPTAACVCFLVAPPASAASLTGPISGWQKANDPGTASMYEYVPSSLAQNPPILVLIHYCGGNAAGVFGEAEGGGLVSAADQYGFIMVVPQTSNNCWDAGDSSATDATLTHDAGGDSEAIVDMVKYFDHEAQRRREPRVRDRNVFGRHDDGSPPRGLSRRVPGRFGILGSAGGLLGRQRPCGAVERSVRGRHGHAYGGTSGAPSSRTCIPDIPGFVRESNSGTANPTEPSATRTRRKPSRNGATSWD